jgi:hypothetical protein
MSQLAGSREEAMNSKQIRTVFNYAMAEWGERKVAPSDLLRRVVELDRDQLAHSHGANYFQCIALACLTLSDMSTAMMNCERARRRLDGGYVFSSWRYLLASSTEMAKDIDAIEKLARHDSRKDLRPPFLTRVPPNHATKREPRRV